MNPAAITAGVIAVIIIALVVAAFLLLRKGEAAGKRTVQADLLEQQNKRLQTGAAIDAKPMPTPDALDTMDKLADR